MTKVQMALLAGGFFGFLAAVVVIGVWQMISSGELRRGTSHRVGRDDGR